MTVRTRDELLAEYGPAGPGSYEGNAFPLAAAYVHDGTLSGGTTEERGTIEYGPGWFGLVHFNLTEIAELQLLDWHPDPDASPESRPVSAIVREDDRGFVGVVFYDSEDAALADWEEIEAEWDRVDALNEEEDDL